METEFQGDPVAGGTYPAGIFKTFIESLVAMKKVKKDTTETTPVVPPGTSTSGVSDAPSTPDSGNTISGGGASSPTPAPQQAPAQPEPTQAPSQPTPAPTQPPAEPPPSSGGATPDSGGEPAPQG
jgi:hypothetical protein